MSIIIFIFLIILYKKVFTRNKDQSRDPLNAQDWSPFNLEFYVTWIHVAESKTKMHSSLVESNNIPVQVQTR